MCDHGTLVQLKNLINRRNVGSDPTKNVHACDDFVSIVTVSHFLVATMKMLKMSDLDDAPEAGHFNIDSWMLPKDERRKLLYSFCKKVILKHTELSLPTKKGPTNTDRVQEYAHELMTLGMLYLNYKDAIREGDGPRIINTWKCLLPIFIASGRRNYSVEILLALYNYYFVLTPRQASQLVWSRFVNTQGLPGHNKPLDLHMEHLNRICKGCISGLGANKTAKAISRIGNAIGPLQEVLDNFDTGVLHVDVSGHHNITSCTRDRNMIIKELMTSASVFDELMGRFHHSFRTFRPLLSKLPKKKYEEWIKQHFMSWQ